MGKSKVGGRMGRDCEEEGKSELVVVVFVRQRRYIGKSERTLIKYKSNKRDVAKNRRGRRKNHPEKLSKRAGERPKKKRTFQRTLVDNSGRGRRGDESRAVCGLK